MLNLKKLLTKVLNSVFASQSIKTATVASGFSGDVKYVHFGNICVFSGYINTSGALTAGVTLASGFPSQYIAYQNFGVYANNNNSSTETVTLMLNSGELRVKSALTSANRALRFSGAYLTSTVGGYCLTVFSRLSAIFRSVRGWLYAEFKEATHKDTESASSNSGKYQSWLYRSKLKRSVYGNCRCFVINPIGVQIRSGNSTEFGFVCRGLLSSGSSKQYIRYCFFNEKNGFGSKHNSEGISYLRKGIANSRKGVMACA